MIYTDTVSLKRYLGIEENLDAAIRYLLEKGTAELQQGKNPIDGDNVFINRFGYMTIPEQEACFEAHLQYADIHIVLKGEEYIGVTPLKRLDILKTDKENDNIDCQGNVETKVLMQPGKILIVFPEDAHKVKISVGQPVRTEKAVVKVKVKKI